MLQENIRTGLRQPLRGRTLRPSGLGRLAAQGGDGEGKAVIFGIRGLLRIPFPGSVSHRAKAEAANLFGSHFAPVDAAKQAVRDTLKDLLNRQSPEPGAGA